MRILYILKHNPWGIGGGCYACRNYLELFSELFKDSCFDVLICSEYLESRTSKEFVNCTFYPVSPRSKISQYLSPVTQILHRHQRVAVGMIEKNQYDYCIFDHNSIAGSLVGLCKKKGIKTIVLNHNCELEYFRDNNSRLKNFLLLSSVRKNERKAYLECDYNIFLTDEDWGLFKSIYGESRTKAIVGGCFNPKTYVAPSISMKSIVLPSKKHLKMVISGTLGNVQNIDGINFFLNDLLPYVPHNVQIVLAGKNPPVSLIERLNSLSPRVMIVPNPKNIDMIVHDCDIFLCPTRLGGGIKLRIMDGFRNGLPVLTHAVSARGYNEFERVGFMWKFENAIDFENALLEIITRLSEERNLKRQIQNYANEKFSFWNAVFTFKKKMQIM